MEEQKSNDSIHKFVDSVHVEGSFLNKVYNLHNEEGKSELDKQLKTFAVDIQKMDKGKMTYAEMRGLYG